MIAIKSVGFALLVIVLISASTEAQDAPWDTGYLMFPHFATGGSDIRGSNLSSEIVLVNPEKNDVSAYFEFFNQDGTHATDLLDGYFMTIPALGTRSIALDITGPLRVGWISILLGPSNDHRLIGSLKITIPGIGSAAVPGSFYGPAFMFPVRKIGGTSTTAVAIANSCPIPVPAQIQIRDSTGATLGSKTVTLPASGQIAKYIEELVPVNRSAYDGSVIVTALLPVSQNPCFGLTVISFDLGSKPGEFVVQPVGRVN